MKKLISLLLTGLMCANLTAPALAAEDTADTAAPGKTVVTFTDMPSSPEFVESITWAVENDITTGMYDGQFRPDYTCNISQILTFIWRTYLWRLAGSPPESDSPFSDVKSTDNYAAAVAWGAANGIIKGITPTIFGPYNTCTRAHIVTFLHRYSASLLTEAPAET